MRDVLLSDGRCRLHWALALGCLAGAVVLLLALGGGGVQAAEKVPIPGQGATCAACHAEASAQWATSLHRRSVGAPHIPEGRQACAACHVGAEEHLADLTDEAKRPGLAGQTADEAADMCLSCHRGGKQMLWHLSAHASTGEACLACHDPHGGYGPEMLKAPEPELCAECHPVPVAEGEMPSHHPIREGKMVCSDCHNVHGDERGRAPEAYNVEMCYRCHGEKEGPFLFEHPPVTEDCTTCHRPHGSPNDYLLIQDQPLLCLQCHPGHGDGRRGFLVPFDPNDPASVAEGELAIEAFYAKCTSCHSRIHGTDLASGTDNGTFMPGSPLGSSGGGGHGSGLRGASALDRSYWGFAEFELGTIDEDDSQNFVREYDGRNYDVPAPGLSVSRFTESGDFQMFLKDFARGDQDFGMRFGNPNYDVQIYQSALTHRLGRFNDPIEGEGLIEFPGINGGLEDANFTDLTAGKNDFKIDRTTFEIRAAARCPKVSSVKWTAGLWQEAESGSRQFLFLDRCDACHKHQIDEPIDRVTTVIEGGVEVNIGSGVLRYMREDREVKNKASETFFDFSGVSSVASGPAPLFGVPDTKGDTDDVRGAARLSDSVYATAVWQDKERSDRLGGGNLDLTTGGGAVSWRLSDDFRVGASFLSRDEEVSNIRQGVSRDRQTSRIDVRYTGIRGSTLSLGYTNQDVDRDLIDENLIPQESDSDIVRAAVVSRFGPKTTLQVRYRNTDTDVSDFFVVVPGLFPARLIGLPTDEDRLSSILSYYLSNRAVLSGIYTDRDATWEVKDAGLGVDHQAHAKTSTTGVQFVYNAGPRAKFRGSYYDQNGDTRSDVTCGTGDFTLSPPLSPADIVFPPIESTGTYSYDAAISCVGGTYQVAPRWRLFGQVTRTRTDGEQTVADLGDYLDQDPDLDGVDFTFAEFDIDISDAWIGLGYLVDPRTELTLSYQRRDWQNDADVTQDGAYTVWRLGARGEF